MRCTLRDRNGEIRRELPGIMDQCCEFPLESGAKSGKHLHTYYTGVVEHVSKPTEMTPLPSSSPQASGENAREAEQPAYHKLTAPMPGDGKRGAPKINKRTRVEQRYSS